MLYLSLWQEQYVLIASFWDTLKNHTHTHTCKGEALPLRHYIARGGSSCSTSYGNTTGSCISILITHLPPWGRCTWTWHWVSGEREGWRNENGVSRGITIDIMKWLVISRGRSTWEGNKRGDDFCWPIYTQCRGWSMKEWAKCKCESAWVHGIQHQTVWERKGGGVSPTSLPLVYLMCGLCCFSSASALNDTFVCVVSWYIALSGV